MEILCLDIGSSKISGSVSDENGVMHSVSTNPIPTGTDIKKTVIEKIFDYTDRIIDRNDIDRIGISVPGLTDADKGIWVYSPVSGIHDLDLRKLLGDKYNLPVYAENDVNACALAEKRFGVCKDEDDYMWIAVTNGVGGSIVTDGRLYKGIRGNAGEIGHIVVNENGPVCRCGNKGCLEAQASCYAIENTYLDMYPGDTKSYEEITTMVYMGHHEVAKMFYDAGYFMGKAVASAATLLDIGLFVFGGAPLSFELMEKGISDGIERYAFKGTGLTIKTVKTGLENKAELLGALTVALNGKKY